jgi:outer membrane protein assembly factor BamB
MFSLPAILASMMLSSAADLQVKATDWPQFRGPNRDAVSAEKGLLKKWPDAGPQKLWTVNGVGGGYGSVAVVGGYIFGTGKKDGAKKKEGSEFLWARDEATGKLKWERTFSDWRNVGYGEGPRSTPTYANGHVYALGVAGDLVCCNATTGAIVWKKNYVSDFGGSVQSWGYSESVLVDDGKVIGTPCSKDAAIVALDAKTGEVIWKTSVKNPGGAGGYASPVKAELNGVPMYITLLGNAGGVVAVHAKSGKLLWQYTKMMNGTANIPSPVVKGDLVFASTGYGAGAALLKMKADGENVTVEELKFYKGNQLQNHHGGMTLVGDYVYLGNQHNQGFPACVELKTGEIKWKENNAPRGCEKSAAIAAADGMIYFRYENGVIALVEANPEEFKLVSTFKIPEPSNKPSWPHLAIASGKLYVRDQDKLHCFNLKDRSN